MRGIPPAPPIAGLGYPENNTVNMYTQIGINWIIGYTLQMYTIYNVHDPACMIVCTYIYILTRHVPVLICTFLTLLKFSQNIHVFCSCFFMEEQAKRSVTTLEFLDFFQICTWKVFFKRDHIKSFWKIYIMSSFKAAFNIKLNFYFFCFYLIYVFISIFSS